MPKTGRVLPIDGSDPMEYVSHGIPVMFTSNPVQIARWQDFLESFNFDSAMPDMMNVRYLVHDARQYEEDRQALGPRYVPVFASPDGSRLVLENRGVLPKAWLAPSALLLSDPRQILGIMQQPSYNPRSFAVVEVPPPIPMPPPMAQPAGDAGEVTVTRYEANDIACDVRAGRNALLVLGEKFHAGWRARVDGTPTEIHRVNYILRGVYLPPGRTGSSSPSTRFPSRSAST